MRFRPFLIRFLLLAVLFNTAIGMPLHEAGHLREVVASLAGDVDPDGDAGGAQGVCAACIAHAQQATAMVPPLLVWRAPEPASHALPWRVSAAFVPDPGRWPFAARDPPVTST